MKPLTPEEQFQIQLDVQSIKSQVEDFKRQIIALSECVQANQDAILTLNKTVTAHHELLVTIVEKIK